MKYRERGRASARPGMRRGSSILLLLVFLAIVIARCSSRDGQDAEDQVAISQALSEEKYRSAGDEGLGAAVAIVIDNSGR